jgi:peptidoglycan/xylan/chitin deacetylase (PgdA/CDA1 family)
MKTSLLLAAAALCAAALPVLADEADSPVRIAKWKGDAKGAVSLYYDDGLDSGFNNAVPELVRRGLPGTFYICCDWFGGDPANPKLARWSVAKEHPDTIFLGDHTWKHGGVTNAAQFAEEISLNGAMLRKIAGLPEDALLSFALPGAVRWDVKPDEQAKVLAEHHEVLRHDFGGNVGGPKDGQNPTFRMKTAALAAEAFDRAERNGGWESLIFHGVGGDWITFDLEEHGKMLDDLEARAKAGRLWVGSAIDVHKYETERDAAKLQVLKASDAGYDVLLPGLDPAKEGSLGLLYDCPLTIVCDAPAGWTKARVVCRRQAIVGKEWADLEVPVEDGRIVFSPPREWIGFSVLPVR